MGEGMKRAFAAAKATRMKTFEIEIFEWRTGKSVRVAIDDLDAFKRDWYAEGDGGTYGWRMVR